MTRFFHIAAGIVSVTACVSIDHTECDANCSPSASYVGAEVTALQAIDDHSSSTPKAARSVTKIVIIGDSIMAGAVAEGDRTGLLAGPYNNTTAALLTSDHGKIVVNLSHSGQSLKHAAKSGVYGGVNFVTAEGKSQQGTAVWIQLGHNDWFMSQGRKKIVRDYRKLLSGIKRGEAISVYCVVPPISYWDITRQLNTAGNSYEDLRDTIRFVAKSGKCKLVETSDWFNSSDIKDGSTISDGLHFGPRGHLIYTNKMLGIIK